MKSEVADPEIWNPGRHKLRRMVVAKRKYKKTNKHHKKRGPN